MYSGYRVVGRSRKFFEDKGIKGRGSLSLMARSGLEAKHKFFVRCYVDFAYFSSV
jgi:hypothetical protein